MSTNHSESLLAFERLLEIMDDLREKCPWDKKQTMESLRNLTIEETYELAEEIAKGDTQGIKEEVGDIMLHMVFYSKIASESNDWNVADSLNAICEKLIHRHPHIYGDVKVVSEEDVKRNWEALKLAEGKKSILQGVPNGLPALVKAFRMQEKVKHVGFEWSEIEDVWNKVQEELAELQEATVTKDISKITDEFGDVLFSLINYARFLKIDPEMALERTNQKFKRRFEYIESQAGDRLQEMSLADMDVLWEEAKTKA